MKLVRFEPIDFLVMREQTRVFPSQFSGFINHEVISQSLITFCCWSGDAVNMLQSALVLLSDPVRRVRMEFSSVPQRSFQNSSMEVIGQFVDKILTISGSGVDFDMRETLMMTMFSLGECSKLVNSLGSAVSYTSITVYCRPKYFSDLTIIPMIAGRKHY